MILYEVLLGLACSFNRRTGQAVKQTTIVNASATRPDLTMIPRAFRRKARTTLSSVIFSSPLSMLRRPRPARATQVFSRACKSPSTAIHAGTNSSRYQLGSIAEARSATKMRTVNANAATAMRWRLRHSTVPILVTVFPAVLFMIDDTPETS